MHFTVLAYDAKDSEAPARRQATRAEHLAGIERMTASGQQILGAALLDDAGAMCGSLMVFAAENKAQVEAWIAADPYTRENVWGKIEIIGCRIPDFFLQKK